MTDEGEKEVEETMRAAAGSEKRSRSGDGPTSIRDQDPLSHHHNDFSAHAQVPLSLSL